MPGGGSKPGERRGGRKKGTPNRTTLKAALLPGTNWVLPELVLQKRAQPLPEWVVALTPIDAMLYAMRLAFSAKHYMIATDLAAKVAPYVHPRLMAAQVKHEGTLTLEQLVMELMELPIAQAMIEGDVMPADGSSTAAQMVTAEIDATRALPNESDDKSSR